MEVASFAAIEADFMARVQQAVYCNMATVDRRNRPRSRLVHPVWEGSVGWIISWPETHKSKHLSANPHVSLAYIHDTNQPVYIDCTATWESDRDEQLRVWEYYKVAPPPMGFDPEPAYGNIDHQHFGLLKLIPWRLELFTLRADDGEMLMSSVIWRSRAED
jgi:hypothetical protein